jgi:hypothetical protein
MSSYYNIVIRDSSGSSYSIMNPPKTTIKYYKYSTHYIVGVGINKINQQLVQGANNIIKILLFKD